VYKCEVCKSVRCVENVMCIDSVMCKMCVVCRECSYEFFFVAWKC
jgi:hypothetical protein